MSETAIDREPIELVQFTLPKCANVYGSGLCKAGLGTVADTLLNANFTSADQADTLYTTVLNGTASRVLGGVRLSASGAMIFSSNTAGVGERYSGDDFRYVVVDLTTRSNNCDFTSATTRLVYGSVALNSLVADHVMSIAQAQDWRVADLSNVPINTRLQLVFDATTATDYATTYQGTDIVRLRFDPNTADTDIIVDVHSITVCSQNLFENRGGECYNTRATCQDPDNYRDKPDRHLTATNTYGTNDVIDGSAVTVTKNWFFSAKVRFDSEPDGVIFEFGSSAYLGVTSGNLVFRAGDSSVASGANTGKISFDTATLLANTLTLYGEIEFVDTGTCTIRLWKYCQCSKNLTLLGSDTWTDSASAWAATTDGGVGYAEGTVATGESAADWNGNIEYVYFYDDQYAAIYPADEEEFKSVLTLGKGVQGEPTDQIYILPCLRDLNTIGTRINLAGSDDNYEPLGRRASVDFTCGDFTHSDIGQDPYYKSRLINPNTQSTFWRKWLVRQKFGRVNAAVKVLDGYAGQNLSEYRVREYLLDSAKYGEDAIAFRARDLLSLTEFRKAQVPEVSTGTLKEEMTVDALTFVVFGNVLNDYPASGTVRINDELIQYSSMSYDSGTNETTFTILNSSKRGTDGSVVDEHEVDDLVQLCRRYTEDTVSNVLLGLLMDDAEIPAQQVAVKDIETEDEFYLKAYKLTTLITEPTSVSELIGKLSEECGFYIWWDERDQLIRMQAIRGINVDEDVAATWSYEDNIVGGSFKIEERPKQRLNVIDFYYNPIDFTGDLNKASNFANGLQVINGTTSLPEQYGNYVQTRVIYSRWLSTEAVANQTSSRMSIRFADVPQYAEFYVDAKDRAIWAGDYIKIDHPLVVDEFGNRLLNKRWLVVEAEEVDPGHLIRYRVADITLDGLLYYITADGIGNYTAALFAAGNAFITDNDGLNSDGTEGARLA